MMEYPAIEKTKSDRDLFTCLYQEYRQVLFKKFLPLLNSPETVKDIIQEVFIRAWIKREVIKPESSLKGYMYKIGQNLIFDYYRQKSVMYQSAWLYLWQQEQEWPDENQVTTEDKVAKIEMIVSQLPPQRKRVFELCKYEQKRYQEVSNAMHISLSTISDHIVKAKSFIRSELVRDFRIAG